MTIDLGTGDGRLPFALAPLEPDRLFVGVDASAAALRAVSERAARGRLDNVLYIRAAVEALPRELLGTADRVAVVLPWGSLLAAVARPSVDLLRKVRALCRPGAVLTVVLSIDEARDGAELARLGIPALDASQCEGALRDGYVAAGFEVTRIRRLPGAELRRWPSTWARRLARAAGRSVIVIEARAN